MNPLKKALVGGALAAATLTGGAIGASFFGVANAATSSSSTSSSTPASGTPDPSTADRPAMPPHGSSAHESQEKAVTGDAATQAQAAAVKSVGSGTAGAVTNDFTGKGYEVTVTKSDGSQVDVHLDSSFNVMQGGPHGPGGPGDNDAAAPAQ